MVLPPLRTTMTMTTGRIFNAATWSYGGLYPQLLTQWRNE
jgi:hypothetical protein